MPVTPEKKEVLMNLLNALPCLFLSSVFAPLGFSFCESLNHVIEKEAKVLQSNIYILDYFEQDTIDKGDSFGYLEDEVYFKNKKIHILKAHYHKYCSHTESQNEILEMPYCSSSEFISKPISQRLDIIDTKLSLEDKELYQLYLSIEDKKRYLKYSNALNYSLKLINVPPFVLSVGKMLGLNKIQAVKRLPHGKITVAALTLTAALVGSTLENNNSKRKYYNRKIKYDEIKLFKEDLFNEALYLERWLMSIEDSDFKDCEEARI